MFLLMFILHVPYLLILLGQDNYPTQGQSTGLDSWLFSMTIGNLGKDSSICGKSDYTSSSHTLSLECPQG